MGVSQNVKKTVYPKHNARLLVDVLSSVYVCSPFTIEHQGSNCTKRFNLLGTMNICRKVRGNPCNSCWDVADWAKQGVVLIKGQFRPYARLSHVIVKICRGEDDDEYIWYVYMCKVVTTEGLGDQERKQTCPFLERLSVDFQLAASRNISSFPGAWNS